MATSQQFARSTDKASDQCFDFACSMCAADNKNTEAVKYCPVCLEYLCSTCVKDHNRFPAMRSHKLQDTAGMSGPPPAKFAPTEPCELHHGNYIDTYCGNHDAVCCGTCVSVDHRSCVDITYILDAARDVTKSQEYKTIKATIGRVQSQLEELKKTKKDYKSKLEKDKNICLTKIRDYRNTINKHLDDLEKAASDTVQAKHKEYEERLNLDIKALEEIISRMEASIDQLKNTNKDNEPQVFVYTKMGKQNQTNGEKLLREMKARLKPEPLNFQINTTIEDVIRSVKSLGDFKQADLGDQLYTASLRGRYDVKVKGDSEECNITGSCLLPDGTMLINDNVNNKLKRLDQSYKVTDSCVFPSSSMPYGVCATGPGEAAVALTMSKKIQFVSLGQRMALTKSFNVGQYCWGVAYINTELLVSCHSPGQIHTYNISGKRLSTFQTDAAGQPMFLLPLHMAVSTDNTLIQVSDKNNGVITLDRQGNKLSQFTDPDLKGACCVVYPGSSGQMFVCGFDSDNVLQMSREGQKLGVLLDESHGVMRPRSLWYDSANSRLIVTMPSKHIAVFDLSRK